MFSNKIVVILLGVFLLIGSVFLGVLSWKMLSARNQAVEVPVDNNSSTLPVVEEKVDVATITAAETKQDGEIEWLVKPVKLGDLKLIAYSQESGMSDSAGEYYRVAKIADGGEMINAFMPPQGPGGSLVIRFKKTSAGKYLLIKKNSDFDENYLISKAEIDSETNIKALNAPEKIVINNAEFTMEAWSDKTPLDWSKLDKIGATDHGDFYKKFFPSDFHLSFVDYELRLPDSSAIGYGMKYSFLADDNSLIAVFDDQNKEFEVKRFNTVIRRGCSASSDEIYLSDLADRLVSIGTASSGVILYAPKNIEDEIFKAIFDGYKIGRDGTTSFDGKPVLTYEEFVAKKPAVVWQDALGDYHIFSDSDYSPLAECGKPVIYLYPKTKTEVKVQVGANVRISEPDYNNGWGVTAYPNGKIINSDGAVYENLYWEGLGQGYYPAITQGRVVKRVDIETELKSDLAKLGLNKKEAADFMEFWLPKMPKTSYIRLTWLDTAEMDDLAPLSISPRPDTVKRVFLDFSGQNTSATDLAPQQLKDFMRTGFTVVEWGGLLLGGK